MKARLRRGRGGRGGDAGRRGERARRDEVAVRPGRRARPVPAEPEHDALPRLGRARRASTPKRARDRGVDCFYVYPTVSDQHDPAGDQARRPRAPLDRALPGRALLAALPRLRARLSAGDRPGAAGRDDDAAGLPDSLRRRRAGLRRVPAAHRPAPRLRPHRPLAGKLSPAAADPPPHRRPRALRRRLVSAVLLGGDVTVRKGRTAAARSAACRPAGGRRSSPA